MNDIQIKGSEDYGKLCCFRDDEGNELYGHLSLFMKAISNNPNERDMYFRQEDGKAYRLAWKVDEEDVLSPDEEVIHEQNKTIERLQDENKKLKEQIKEKGLWISALKSHLEECWEIIKEYAEHEYLTPETFYMRDRLERYYWKAGLGNYDDARKALKKWGVK